jgi:hypothetical protein
VVTTITDGERRTTMTTTPQEPGKDPEVVPSGDPDLHPGADPDVEPGGQPETDPIDPDAPDPVPGKDEPTMPS